jgi:propanol-preferring alcohol dehydrogenase
VQYAKAMGLHVAAVDVHADKLRLARELGADLVINAAETEPGPELHKQVGGMHGVLVTAVSLTAFKQAMGMLRRRGTMSLVGLPPGDFPVSVFNTVLNRITIRGSIVGTRQDLVECLAFAGEGKVKATFSWEPLEAINDVFHRMEDAAIDGRVVLRI